MTQLKLKIITILLLVGIGSKAQPVGYQPVKSETEVSSRLKEYAAKLKSVQSTFKQEKHLEYLDVALESGGKFWFQSPDKVRWEYEQPYNYILILNSGKLKMISDKSNNEIDMKGNAVFEQVNNLMVAAVSGNVFDNIDYKVKAFENSGFYLINIKPVSANLSQMIKEMDLYFDKKNYVVTKIKMLESESDYSVITFSNLNLNVPIETKVFNP
jgi:outer membrane lipoprotein-sorting protein